MPQATLEADESRSPTVSAPTRTGMHQLSPWRRKRPFPVAFGRPPGLPDGPSRASPGGLAWTIGVSADRLGQGARYLSDARGVKGVAGDFFPRCEVSSRSRDEAPLA